MLSLSSAPFSDLEGQVKVVVSDEDDGDEVGIARSPLAKKRKREPVEKSIQGYAKRLFQGYRSAGSCLFVCEFDVLQLVCVQQNPRNSTRHSHKVAQASQEDTG